MNSISKVTLAVFLAMVGLFMGFGSAQADSCVAPMILDAGHCHVPSVITLVGAGPFDLTFDEELLTMGPAASSLRRALS